MLAAVLSVKVTVPGTIEEPEGTEGEENPVSKFPVPEPFNTKVVVPGEGLKAVEAEEK